MTIGWKGAIPMPHDHVSPSGHPYRPDQDAALTYHQAMEIAIREILIEKAVTTPAEITATIEAMDRRSPADGARVVARAWTDPDFKARLLADGSSACREMKFDINTMHLVVVENTKQVHNIIIYTLYSYYPHNLLNLPPN